MKYSFVAVAALASIVSAQLEAFPTCAQACLGPAYLSSGCGDLEDVGCFCRNEAKVAETLACVEEGCSDEEKQTSLCAAAGLCGTAGVTLPGTESCGGYAGSAVEEPAPEEPAEEEPAEEEEEETPYDPAVTSPAEPSAPEATVWVPATDCETTTTAKHNGTTMATPSLPSYTGAAAKLGLGAAGAMIAGAAFLL